MKIFIIPTSQAKHLGKNILAKTKVSKVIFPDLNKDGKRYFPDGEVYTRISEINKFKGRTIIFHSGAPNPNNGLVELEMLLEILRKSKANPIEIFFTYFPYGKQDNVFQAGEINAAENLVRKLIKYYNVERIYTIDAHFAGREWVNKYPITNVSAVNLLMETASKNYPNAIYLAPDSGSQRRTGLELKGLRKKRINSRMVEFRSDEEFKAAVKDRIVGVVDDQIETGATLIPFYDECIKAGAREVIALITHGVLSEGIERVKAKYSKLYLTNTIKQKDSNIDVTNLILKAISKYD
jgi:ribose-phosphate pyrophosphokinase